MAALGHFLLFEMLVRLIFRPNCTFSCAHSPIGGDWISRTAPMGRLQPVKVHDMDNGFGGNFLLKALESLSHGPAA